jgi:RNA polymerase sigma factor (sigma-70 family)
VFSADYKQDLDMSNTEDVSHWIDLIKEGDSVAAHQIWHHYFDRLVRSVRRNLREHNRGMSDEEDIVISVFESFYRAAGDGRFPDLSDRDDLWRLLLKMSARKIVDKRRHDRRQRRGDGIHVRSIDRDGDQDEILQVIGDEPTPEMALMMEESFERLIGHLGVGHLREIAVAKLEGFSNAEIAQRLECSERTIERRLHLIREKCQQELIAENEYTPGKTADRSSGTDR